MIRLLFLLLATSLAAAPIERVWLTHASNDPSKIVINWETATPGDSVVEFGTSAELGKQVKAAESVTLHHVEIPLEQTNVVYHYRVRSGGDASEVFRFKGYPTTELRLAMVGDWGFAKGKDLTSLMKDDPHLLVTLGDNVPDLHGKGREGTKAFSVLIDQHRELFRSTPLMPILGNHDREITSRGPKPPAHAVYDVEATAYRDFFALPDVEWRWRFDIPAFRLRLLALDASHTKDQGTTWQTNHPITAGSEQHAWFAREVARTDADFVLTLNNEQNSLMRGYDKKAWLPLFEQTSAVFTGYGYFAERAEFNAQPYFNTCLKGDGDLYKDPHSRFNAREDHYLLLTLRADATAITAQFKNLRGEVLDTSEIGKRKAATPAPKPKPAFQYESGDIKVSIPTADEPRVTQFGAESIKAAVKYLDDGSTCWVREKSCVNCHTTGPYLSERPALIPQLGKPSEEIVADFIEFVPKEVKEVKETATKSGYKHMPGAFSAVWRSLGLAEWDKHLTGKTSEHTERSIRDMFERQAASGAFVSHGEVEIPHITTDFELSLQAVRTITAAPGWLSGLKDEQLLGKVEKLKTWLRTTEPKNDWDRVLSLQLAFYLPELVSVEKRDAALKLLSSKQHPDGGWSTRDFSALNDWHFEISEAVQKLITSLPDAAKPESDAYMTSLAVVLMRQSNVPAKDERLQKAVTWLKKEQRVSGRWWMHSLYRGNYHYSTYIATCQALKALALCDELPVMK